MSIALLKNLLFPAETRKTKKRHTQILPPADNVQSGIAPSSFPKLSPTTTTTTTTATADPPHQQIHKDSEISWLSCESSIAPESQHKRPSDGPPPPPPQLPEKDDIDLSNNATSTESSNVDLEGQKARRRRFQISPRMISDAIIGISDGMTVPFALTAGLAYLGDTKLVVLGGLAELIAGAISMGLGGFIGAKSEAESYRATVTSTRKLIQQSPYQTSALVSEVFRPYKLPPQALTAILQPLQDSPNHDSMMLDFLMRFHHQTPEPDSARPFICALIISMGYFLGGLVPLIPYFCVRRDQVYLALYWSIGVMAVALFAFGWTKTAVVLGWRGKPNVLAGLKGALQMTMIGGTAAGAAVGLVRAIGH